MPLEEAKHYLRENESFLYRRVDENYGAVKATYLLGQSALSFLIMESVNFPLYLIHRLVLTNENKKVDNQTRIFEGSYFVFIIITLLSRFNKLKNF